MIRQPQIKARIARLYELTNGLAKEEKTALTSRQGFQETVHMRRRPTSKQSMGLRYVRDARLYAAGCNDSHGLRKTPEDKRAAVRMLLADEEWGKASDRWIGDQCHVTHPFVAEVRASTGNVAGENNLTSSKS